MAKENEQYRQLIVESYMIVGASGLHGEVHIRPVDGQGLSRKLQVECSKKLSRNFPVGTQFQIRAKLTDREGVGSIFTVIPAGPLPYSRSSVELKNG